MTHTLQIKPAITPELRHKIQDLLEKEGFSIHGGGTLLIEPTCSDITFSKAKTNKQVCICPGATDGGYMIAKNCPIHGQGEGECKIDC